MVQRNLKSDFVGGAYVFPGGALDDDDHSTAMAGCCGGLHDAAASSALQLASGGLAYYVACLRELYEEVGVLLARHRDGQPLRTDDPALVDRLVEHRRALNAGDDRFASILEREQLVLEPATLAYLAHWITPIGPPRRYDTRFFVAPAPVGQEPLCDDRELVAHTWVTPSRALERAERGEMQLILPTIKNLESIAQHRSVDALLSAVRAQSSVPAIQPRIVARDGGGIAILLPGDEGFEDDTATARARSVTNDDIARASGPASS